jgi:hypothetical protein
MIRKHPRKGEKKKQGANKTENKKANCNNY